jgi:dipeptidyl-peptidase-4
MRELTLDIVARYPPPGMAIPGSFRFSPDGKVLTYLHSEEGTLRRVLWAVDVAGGQPYVLFSPGDEGATDENVSRDEALRRERQRLLHTGVTHYEWAEDADVVLVPVLGALWVIENGAARRVGGNALDPHVSPDGRQIAFVRDGDLWVLDVATGSERQLTSVAEPGVSNGVAEFVAQEEMARSRGFWWSRDGAWIAFEQVDERHVPVFPIPHWGRDALDVDEIRYPFAGEQNARTRLGVAPSSGGDVRWLDTEGFEYIARAGFHPHGRLFVQLQTRDQRRLELRAYDPASGSGATVLVEEQEPWINLHNDLSFLETTGELIWSSERSGFRQLELRAPDGALVRPLTEHPFPVEGMLQVDSDGRRLAYAAATSPIESHVFAVSLDGGAAERLTVDPGTHSAVFSKDLGGWVDVYHCRTRPPSAVLRTADERVLHSPPEIDLPLVTPELHTLSTREGVVLHAALYRPARLPAPLVVSVYGGPHHQMVDDSWATTIALRTQYLVGQGFAVVSIDNRGSARRGLAFEGAIAGRMGTIEIDDQVDGVRWAQSQGLVDGDRVGITGWSYGGYMTIMCMLNAPEVFRVGVAGAPTISWDGYDTHYTERYMGMPQDNPDGYRDGSALTHAGNLRGKLLIVHGMIDENVHFRHTARFLNALQKAGRSCDLLVYPDERHSPRSERDRRNMHGQIVDYFRTHL